MRALTKCLVAGVATLAAFAVGMFGAPQARAQNGDATATLESAATLTLPRPTDPAAVYLDLWVKAYTPPSRGAVEAVVSLAPAGRDAAVEIGRFAVFPSEPFIATEARDQRAYRFNATAALHALKAGDDTLTLRIAMVSLIDAIPAQGAKLVLGKAAFGGPAP